jgi:hypothetical protein
VEKWFFLGFKKKVCFFLILEKTEVEGNRGKSREIERREFEELKEVKNLRKGE